MASSQVQIALPFHNNLNNLDINDLWVHQPQWKAGSVNVNGNRHGDGNGNGNRNTETDHRDNWARTRDIVFPPSAPSATADVSNPGGVSSLVQKWKGFEAGAKKPPPPPPPPGGGGHLTDDDSSVIGDWESDRTGRDSDATERERLRVVDIIRKLTPNDSGSVSPPRLRTSLDHSDLRGLPPPVPGSRVRTSWDCDLRCLSSSSTRIRGRQAYLDLLLQMERERCEELLRLGARKAVTTFANRGRIQAMLKIKLLRRGMEAKDSNSIPFFESHKSVHCRERLVNPKPEHIGSHSERRDNTFASSIPSYPEAKSCPHPAVPKVDTPRLEADCIAPVHQDNTEFFNSFEDLHQGETSTAQETSWESITDHTLPKSEPPQSFYFDEIKEAEELDYVETGAQWVAEEGCEEGWEEFEYTEEQTNNRDWIDEVSRPRSDWEYMRQERYQEMLNPFLDNEDIRVLLGRKSVSGFLSSGLRDKIDQLMISRTQGPQNVSSSRTQEKKEVGKKKKEEFGEFFDEFEEAESSQQYTECDEFTDPSVASSWSQNQNQGASECSYQAVSPSKSAANYCSQEINGLNASFNSHPSMEMEQIYDLRRHMELLHEEISQLRKAIQFSTDLQIKQHRSIKKQVAAALSHPDVKSGRRNAMKKSRRCCMCSKVQVDCVLYKCGHMCTCFDCAHGLMWNGGSCPVCTVQIVDVIRTQSDD